MAECSYTLYNGDCNKVLHDIPDGSIDLVLTDPPYAQLSLEWDKKVLIDWELLKQKTSPRANFLLFGVQPFTTELINSNIDMFRYNLIWKKSRPSLGHHSKNRPMREYEEISVFSKLKWGHQSQLGNNRMTYNPQGLKFVKKGVYHRIMGKNHTGDRPNQIGKEYDIYTNYPRDILEFSSVEKAVHPTQKPVKLLEYLIKTYSFEYDNVLDFTMGSGSTGVACKQTNRSFTGIELDETYFTIAEERINVNTLF